VEKAICGATFECRDKPFVAQMKRFIE